MEPFALPACFSEVTGAGFGFVSAKEETSFGPQQLNVTLNLTKSMNPQVTFFIQQLKNFVQVLWRFDCFMPVL